MSIVVRYTRYGGIYLDSDVIILKPLSSLKNSLGKENEMDVYNGAVMAFDRNRYLHRFIFDNMLCLLFSISI